MLLIIFLLLPLTKAINENQFKEIHKSSLQLNVDFQWLSTIKTWYVPLWSKLDKIRTASDLLNKSTSELNEKTLKTKSCFTSRTLDKFTTAFESQFTFSCDPIFHGGIMEGYNCPFLPMSGAVQYIFKDTDNENYILGLSIWGDGQVSWSVISKNTKLEDVVKERILNFVLGLGFKREMVVEEDYKGCFNREEL